VNFPHIHYDPNWTVEGVNAYAQCRCGARRTRRAFTNLAGPTKRGWPALVNRHGMPVPDSGWQVMP
jgi:hypothetical protein